MNTPDKIYVNIPGDYWHPGTDKKVDTDIEYIRKDTMLEWAKEKKKQLFQQESANDEPSDVAAGINTGLDIVIGKLNSM